MTRIKIILVFLGGLLGPMNLALFFFIGSQLNHIPFYEKMKSIEVFALFSGFWFFLLFLPSLISTFITLLPLWQPLFSAKTKMQHVLWGVMFGGVATVLSTVLLLMVGSLFDYLRGSSSALGTVFSLGLSLPAGVALGAVFILLLSPALLISGPFYGLMALKLKQIFLK